MDVNRYRDGIGTDQAMHLIKLFFKPPVLWAYGVILSVSLPLDVPLDGSVAALLRIVAALLVLAASTLVVLALLHFYRRRTTVWPGGRPTRLLREGPFAWSRNPLYLAFLLLQFALGAWTGNATFWLSLPVLWWSLLKLHVIPEERKLQEVFGSEFEDYKGCTRRWFGRRERPFWQARQDSNLK